MIEPFEFTQIIKPLTDLYGELPMAKLDVYYEQLKKRDPGILRRAIQLLVRTYTMRSIPLPADITAAYQAEAHELPRAAIEFNDCAFCKGTGYVIVPNTEPGYEGRGYTIAKTCTCSLGRQLNINLSEHDRRYKLRRRKNANTIRQIEQSIKG